MNKLLYLLALLPFLSAEAGNNKGDHPRDTLPKIVIMNGFDASSLQVRKNKRELFSELADSLQVYLAKNIKTQFGLESVLIPGYTKTTDSLVHSIMVSNQSTMAIVIRALEVYFDEGAEKHKEEYGLSPKIETDYNLCSKIDYTFYTGDSTAKESQVNLCDYFTTRSVNDSKIVIRFGPDIVGKKKHTYGAVGKNATNYVKSLNPFMETTTNR